MLKDLLWLDLTGLFLLNTNVLNSMSVHRPERFTDWCLLRFFGEHLNIKDEEEAANKSGA